MCDCIEKTNQSDLHKKYHTRLCYTVPLEQGVVPRVIVKTETTFDAPKRTKAISLMASFCPFCGEKYQDAAKEPDPCANPPVTTTTT
jgi:hypothetical protein